MKIYNIYTYEKGVHLDKTGSVIEPEVPDNIEQWIETGDGVIDKGISKFINEDCKETMEDPAWRIKINTKGDVTTIKIFYIEELDI